MNKSHLRIYCENITYKCQFFVKISQNLMQGNPVNTATFQSADDDMATDFIGAINQSKFDKLLQNLRNFSQKSYENFETTIEQEFFIPANQKQLNQALERFVTNNVNAILDLHIELHDNWLRLYTSVKFKGIFANLAVNLSLVHVQFDRHHQRFVFGQLTNTDVLALHSDNFFKTKAIRFAVWFFHKVLKKDPLGLILGKLNLTHQKEEILYLDIGRWLKKNKKIMDTLKKVQVNHGFLAEEQLIFKANANIGEILRFNSDNQVITEADNPDKSAKTKQ